MACRVLPVKSPGGGGVLRQRVDEAVAKALLHARLERGGLGAFCKPPRWAGKLVAGLQVWPSPWKLQLLETRELSWFIQIFTGLNDLGCCPGSLPRNETRCTGICSGCVGLAACVEFPTNCAGTRLSASGFTESILRIGRWRSKLVVYFCPSLAWVTPGSVCGLVPKSIQRILR